MQSREVEYFAFLLYWVICVLNDMVIFELYTSVKWGCTVIQFWRFTRWHRWVNSHGEMKSEYWVRYGLQAHSGNMYPVTNTSVTINNIWVLGMSSEAMKGWLYRYKLVLYNCTFKFDHCTVTSYTWTVNFEWIEYNGMAPNLWWCYRSWICLLLDSIFMPNPTVLENTDWETLTE